MIIAGERSGVGKTTLTLALLAFLAHEGYRVQAFKVGPDYIDPMFHRAITGIPSRNLDPILTSPDYVQSCFNRHSHGVDYVVVEGVMGLFDGVKLPSSIENYGSTAHIAKILQLPVALVIDCSRLSGSVAAIAYGYGHLDPEVKIAGVILNKVGSDRHLKLLESALASIKMPILGVFHRNQDISIPDRHLGLIPTPELPQIQSIIDKLATLAKTCFNWELLLPLLDLGAGEQGRRGDKGDEETRETRETGRQGRLERVEIGHSKPKSSVKIAVAYDRAFNFYYQDNFDILQELGAELIFWSPLEAKQLPQNIAGMYFGGGFPEVFAEPLSSNYAIRKQVYQAAISQMPIYAECGGLMYLCDRIVDFDGKEWDMVGAIPTTARMSKSLTLGYRQVTPLRDSCVMETKLNSVLWAHEFHRSQLDDMAEQPLWEIQDCYGNKSCEGWQINQIHASYLHLHFGESRNVAHRWIESCRNYRN